MTLSQVSVGEYFTVNDEVYYKGPSGILNMEAKRLFAKFDGDPEVTVIDGEKAYKTLKQKGAAL